MPLSGCTSGLVVTAVLTLLLLPAPFYVPELYPNGDKIAEKEELVVLGPQEWRHVTFENFPPLDVFLTATLLTIALCAYIVEWIQRKITQRRLLKINNFLNQSVDRLRIWDVQQEQLENTLKLVQNATSEYNLLLYLLLRQHHCLPSTKQPLINYFDKNIEEEMPFLRQSTVA